MRKHALSLTIGLLSLATSGSLLAQSAEQCSALQGVQLPGFKLQVTAAQHHVARSLPAGPGGPATDLPPHCQVTGELDRRIGADGKSYALRFAINLPDAWNGRFLFQGGGGLNGAIREPTGAQAAGSESALSRGFAVVSTDSGHEGAGFDASFMADQEAALNFYFLGNMRVTQVAKPLVEQYYAKQISKSYFVGCSTGGREGMIMAQRYPTLFDGIVSGAPAIRTGLSNLGLRWYNVQLNRAVQATGIGEPQPGGQFSPDEQKLIVDGLLQACDARDGVADGLVFDVAGCDFDPRALACEAGASEGCLAPEKAEALVRGLAGPVDSRGNQVYSRFVLDSGNDDNQGFARGLLGGGATPPEGVSVVGLMDQDVDAEFAAMSAPDLAIGDSVSTKLSTFAANGGKQIFYHGMSDAWFSAMDTVHYYDHMAAANGGLQVADNFSRVFLVPGMGHCAGGEQTLDSFDMLSTVVNWVENGEAPASVVATGASMPGVSRPLCPHPQHPHYTGSGDSNDAANFECRAAE